MGCEREASRGMYCCVMPDQHGGIIHRPKVVILGMAGIAHFVLPGEFLSHIPWPQTSVARTSSTNSAPRLCSGCPMADPDERHHGLAVSVTPSPPLRSRTR